MHPYIFCGLIWFLAQIISTFKGTVWGSLLLFPFHTIIIRGHQDPGLCKETLVFHCCTHWEKGGSRAAFSPVCLFFNSFLVYYGWDLNIVDRSSPASNRHGLRSRAHYQASNHWLICFLVQHQSLHCLCCWCFFLEEAGPAAQSPAHCLIFPILWLALFKAAHVELSGSSFNKLLLLLRRHLSFNAARSFRDQIKSNSGYLLFFSDSTNRRQPWPLMRESSEAFFSDILFIVNLYILFS